MRINSKLGTQHAALDDTDAGEGLSIFFSQDGPSVCRYRFVVKARIDEGLYDMGEFYSSPPLSTALNPGRLSRMIAGAVCPGATGWSVEVSAVPIAGEIAPETADIILASSRCCTGPVGTTRVNERYRYLTDQTAVPQNVTILAGQKVTGIAAIGLTGGGTVEINSGPTVTVPEGISFNFEPGASIPPNSVIAFDNVDWVIELLESA
jgi:hypothetical protein